MIRNGAYIAMLAIARRCYVFTRQTGPKSATQLWHEARALAAE